jgi:hypothetical protein
MNSLDNKQKLGHIIQQIELIWKTAVMKSLEIDGRKMYDELFVHAHENPYHLFQCFRLLFVKKVAMTQNLNIIKNPFIHMITLFENERNNLDVDVFY